MKFGFSRRNVVRHARQRSGGPLQRRRLAYDCLEDRRMLSGGTLNTTSPQAITVDGTSPSGGVVPVMGSPYSVAMDSNGDTVVVWADTRGQSTYSLEFELYAKIGSGSSSSLVPVASGPLETTSGTPITDKNGFPVVAMSPTSGEFAVGWNASDNLLTRVNSAYLQLYSFSISTNGLGTTGSATPTGSEIVVGKTSAAYMRQIAMNDQGFDVLYGVPDGNWAGFSDPTVQQYTSSGAKAGGPIAVAKLSGQYSNSSIAMDSSGNFVVGYGDSIYQKQAKDYQNTVNWQRYASSGNAYGTIAPVVLSYSTSSENGSLGLNLAMDANDDIVTAYQFGGLSTTEVTAANVVEPRTLVDSTAQVGGGDWASISMQPATGNYALAWGDDVTGGWNVLANTFDLSGTARQSPILVYSTVNVSPKYVQGASAAIDSGGDLVVVYGAYEFNSTTNTWDTDGGLSGDFYQDPPTSITTTSPSTTSPSGSASPSGSTTTAATDAVFAAFAYPEGEDTLG